MLMRCQLTSWCPCAMATLDDYFSHQTQRCFTVIRKNPSKKIRKSFQRFGKGLKFHYFSDKPPKMPTQPVGSVFVFCCCFFVWFLFREWSINNLMWYDFPAFFHATKVKHLEFDLHPQPRRRSSKWGCLTKGHCQWKTKLKKAIKGLNFFYIKYQISM